MLRSLLGTQLMIEQKSRTAFNLDTILLSDFAKIPYRSKVVLDVGTGAGPIMLYLSQKTNAKIIGIEIQEDRFLQARHNININHLEHQCSVIHQDIKLLDMKDVDCIVTNPPFFKINETSNVNESLDDTIARHEMTLDLESLIETASRLLKYAGYLTMIHRPDRFAEIISVMNRNHMEIKRVRFVHPYINDKANHVLIEAVKKGAPGMMLEPPLILYVEKHIPTKELVEIYGGRSYAVKSAL